MFIAVSAYRSTIYTGYEDRRKLLFMYEQFIVDQAIAVKVNAFLGTRILHDGRAAFPIDLSNELTLTDKVHQALRMVFYIYTHRSAVNGDKESKNVLRVERHSMAYEEIVKNIVDLLYQLKGLHTGGCNNVWKLVIRANSNVGKSFQIYEDNSPPIYPKKTNTDAKTEGDKMDIHESLQQNLYIHMSIIQTENIVLDKEEELNDSRLDSGRKIVTATRKTRRSRRNPANNAKRNGR